MAFNIALHILSAVVWVGGMFFAHQALRPAAVQVLEPPLRLELWVQVFRRFFVWVWLSVSLLLITGYWMLFSWFGGFAGAPIYVHLMQGGGLVMVCVYLFVFFVPYRGLKQSVIVQDYPKAAANLNVIRRLVGFNTLLGILVISTAAGGRYL